MSNNKHMLIVDDDEMICEFIKAVLSMEDYTFSQAENGKEGLKKFKHEHFDLVITDIVMPEMEGISLIRELRAKNKNIPIIAMTGNIHGRMEEYLDLTTQIGANHILRKPIKPADLINTVEMLL